MKLQKNAREVYQKLAELERLWDRVAGPFESSEGI